MRNRIIMGPTTRVLLISWTLLLILQVTQAGPLKRADREIREVYPEIENAEKPDGSHSEVCIVGDVVYGMDEEIPSEQPCLKCKCQPPGVHCETTRCQKKPGCRAIHKPNQCCPDYQCECEHKGRTYANGERLETVPGGECKVCYCRGGEVQCADVSCYIRTDCEGRTVAGQCCPKYDHCPPKAPSLEGTNQSTNSRITEQSLMTTTAYSNISNENEIETTSSSTTSSNTNSKTFNKIHAEPTEDLQTPEAVPKQTTNDTNMPEITIREIIPEVPKEIPITGPPKRELLVTSPSIEQEDARINNNDLLDTDTESSEILENYQPPPVLRIGDKLLFLKKGQFVPEEKDVSTPSPVITIIGAEGLQRGFEESLENHEFVINENLEKNNSAADEEEDDVVGSESVIVEERVEPTKESNPKREVSSGRNRNRNRNSNDSKDEYEDYDVTKASVGGKEEFQNEEPKVTLVDESLTSIDIDNTTVDIAVQIPTLSSVLIEDGTENGTSTSSTTTPSESSTPAKEQLVVFKTDEDVENPEYPPIPDAMEAPVDQLEQLKQHPKILPEVLPLRSNKTAVNATNGEWLKTQTLFNEGAKLSDDVLSQVAPSDLELTSLPEEGEEPISTSTNMPMPDDVVVKENIARLVAQYTSLTQKVAKLKEHSELPTTNVVPTITGLSTEARSTETLENTDTSLEVSTVSSSKESLQSSENSTSSVENASLLEDDAHINKTTQKFDLKDVVEMLPKGTPNRELKPMPKDVEMIAPIKTAQEEEGKAKAKRTNDDPDDIFKELDQELDLLEHPEQFTKSPEEEKAEAELIFKELLDEIDGKHVNKGKEIAEVSKVIAKYNTRGNKQSLDTSLLGIFREFISTQLKYSQE